MISLFQRENPCYSHIVAVDVGSEAFGRIWVIAEIAEVFAKNIKLETVKAVMLPNVRRPKVDVSKAKASRPEDEAFILGKIEDKKAFNERVALAIAVPGFVANIESFSVILQACGEKW